MSTEEGIKTRHPVNLPTSLPVEDIPPDDTLPADTLADKSIAAEALAEEEPMEAELVVIPGEKGLVEESKTVTEVVEKKVTVVEETVTTVEEVMQDTGEVVAKSVTDIVTVDEILTVNETVVSGSDRLTKLASGNGELTEVEEEKGDKKRLRDEAEVTDDGTDQVGDVGAAAVKKLKANGSELEVGEELKGAVMATEEEGEGEELEKKEQGDEDVKDAKSVGVIKLGPKVFEASVEMFTYFYDLLHNWNVNCNVNKYEFMVLSDLINQGAPHKVGAGLSAFQIRMHPSWQSRCYYLIRTDGSEDDFSYRKCVDKLMPLPESLFAANGDLDLHKLFPKEKGSHYRNQNGGRGGGNGGGGRGGGGFRGGRGGGFQGGRGGGGRGGRGGGGGRRGGRGRWGR